MRTGALVAAVGTVPAAIAASPADLRAVVADHGRASSLVLAIDALRDPVALGLDGQERVVVAPIGAAGVAALEQLDPLKHRLTDPDGALVPLSTAEFRMLRAFCDHPRQVLDRDRLLDMVQGREAHLFDRAVDNQISRLRRKIEADSRDPRFIQTVRGGGYRFATDVARLRRADEG